MSRDNRFDFYRGLLMIGVVYGHVLTALQGGSGITYPLHQFVRTFDMPMFAFISGIFLRASCNRRPPYLNVLNKLGGVLLPAILWEFLFNLAGGTVRIAPDRFWYLYSIFFVSVIVIVIDGITRGNTLSKGILFASSVIIFHTLVIDQFKIGFLLAPAIVGYYYNDLKEFVSARVSIKWRSVLKSTLVFTFILEQCYWKLDYNVWNLGCDVLKNGQIVINSMFVIFRFIIGINGCFVMKWLYDNLYDYLSFKENTIQNTALSHCVLLGTSTLEIYILQCQMVTVWGAKIVNILSSILGRNYFVLNNALLVWIIAPFVTLAALYTMYGLQVLLKKIPFVGKYMFSIPLRMKSN